MTSSTDLRQFFPSSPEDISWQAPAFGRWSRGGEAVSTAVIEEHIKEIDGLCSDIEHLADRSVAHLDQRGAQVTVTFANLSAAIEKFNRLGCKYLAFLTGWSYDTLEATVLYNWREVFEYPWVKPQY